MLKSLPAIIVIALIVTACSPAEEPVPAKPAAKVETNTSSKTITDAAPVVSESDLSESERVNAFFERVFEDSVARSPEFLTSLGRKDRADEWNDLSEAFADESRKRN